MKKSLVYAICILIMFPLVSLEVDRVELESAGSNDSIVFVNYEGPHDVINSIEEIKSIGSELGVIIEPDATVAQNIGETDRYYVIHAVDPNTSSGLDADILVLGENALVDHIDNVRRIIAGYLESAYGYTPENASTIAVFTTVYNAVYRGQQDVFNAKYKSVVTENLIAEKIGLSVDYRDWPGNTQIIIPLATLDGQ
ncbi:MAG: P83/100 family protein [Spirochaetales bacterium]